MASWSVVSPARRYDQTQRYSCRQTERAHLLLCPAVALDKDPCRSDLAIIVRPADYRGVGVGGQQAGRAGTKRLRVAVDPTRRSDLVGVGADLGPVDRPPQTSRASAGPPRWPSFPLARLCAERSRWRPKSRHR
jgi:hypothetical protein